MSTAIHHLQGYACKTGIINSAVAEYNILKSAVGFSPKFESITIRTQDTICYCDILAWIIKCAFQNNGIITAYNIAI